MNTSVQHSPSGDDFGLPAPVEPPRPLGPRQYAFWILQQLAPDSAVSNLTIVLRTERRLRWWPLHAAANHLVARHAALRTRFPAAAGVPLRHVSSAADVQLAVESVEVAEADLTERLHAAARRPFDLSRELPVRVGLYQIAGGGSAVLLVAHHVISDAMSLSMLTDELARAYDGVAAGLGIPAELRDEVRDDVAEPVSRPDDLAHWTRHLDGVDTTAMAMPWARPSPARPTFAGGTIATTLSPRTVSALASLRKSLGGTDNLILLAAFYLTLFRHGAGPDMVVGVPVTSRSTKAATGLGFQVSTLPLRLTLDPQAGFAALTRQVRDAFLTGVQHASASIEEILTGLGHHSPDWRVPLFRHMFNYRPWDEGDVKIAGEKPTSPTLLREDSRLDLQLTILEGQPPEVLANYSAEVHDEADIVALLARMETLVAAAAEDPHRPVAELDMLSAAEREVIGDVNGTARAGYPDRAVLQRFLAHAETEPQAVAVIDGDNDYSYAQLSNLARQVAARLRADGVGTGDIVALALPRSAALAAAILGVWAAGACYLPLDAEHPAQRLAQQLADARARLVLAESTQDIADSAGTPVVTWSEVISGGAGGDELELPADAETAYVIYTSGSTGTPRGVVVSHRNLANVVADFADRLGVSATDAVLWSTTTAFDISGLELCLPLSTGGTLVIAGAQAQVRPRELLDLVAKHDVSVVQATPTFWRTATEVFTDGELRGRTVLCGGEPMTAGLARDLLATGCRLFNVYGPTETTIWSTAVELAGDVTDPVPIGGPLANTTVTILDEHGAQQPPGLLGELCIGGAGVTLGYLNRPELTAERFPQGAQGRYYRTGDLARWRADGVLELFGRNDRQVKLRGHRLELPEIEGALRSHPAVAEAAAVIVGDPQGDAELRAFVILAPEASSAVVAELWPYLSQRLPSYALPSRLRLLDEFPVSPNGKTDYGALRALDLSGAEGGPPPADDHPDPNPELTRRLLALWRDTLARPGLGEGDHFFLNGGHSLLAARLAGRIADMLGEDLPLRAIFDHPTARLLSAHLSGEH
ncbi:MAG: amino acid adenylation domain-containing protein [Hamadaea sp.]|uniref:non-ribosomal peptide synthetase n=1 Tax=Hamadaea sp. TaxID=2024425 RepID=UPI0017EBD3E8|nr:amino acid adenylation domain-containing protein [Hamadaea sp.]NUR72860.1 amino acid adenylation domain-containing protein [Hamadaea sp.]NUT20858.1 amino acid adenylation domain-containing protein [Hamadaea sp.]